jgi:hypothetical protein
MESPALTPVLKTRRDLHLLVRHLRLQGLGVEVGVMEGVYTEYLARETGLTIYGVDAWRSFDEHDYQDGNNADDDIQNKRYIKAARRLAGLNARLIREESVPAANQFDRGSLVLVYIDANHRYERVMQDLLAWYPKLARGGIFAGHDYLDCDRYEPYRLRCDVKRAVDEFAACLDVDVLSTQEPDGATWYWVKR